MMECKHCGKQLNDDAKFCPYCGNEVKLEFSYCPACGEEVEAQMVFCPACGYELDKMDMSMPATAEEDTFFDEETNAKYNVVVQNAGDSKIELIKIIRNTMKLDLALATKLAEKLPLPLYMGLSKADAEQKAAELREKGMTVTVETSSISQADVAAAETNVNTVKTENNEKKAKFKTVTVLKVVSAVLLIVVAALGMFLPLIKIGSYEMVNGESVRVETQYSLFALMLLYVKAIVANMDEFSFDLQTIYAFLSIALVISIVAIAVTGVKKLIEHIKNLTNFDKYCEAEFAKDPPSAREAQEATNMTKKASKYGTWGGIFMNMVFGIVFGGYGSLIFSTVIIVGALCCVGGLFDSIIKGQENNIWKM
ncbi:MAG: ribosomal protein L7/L12 [Clostridia bacterium]|nr:ribosomal protein L7/L12 [Clostridia bacterium]